MRPLLLTLALVATSSACVGSIEERPFLGSDTLELEAGIRDPIAKRIRALLPARGIVKYVQPTFSGDGARKEALWELGRALVHDKILSDNRDISCMTCHPASLAGDDDRHLSEGVRGTGVGAHRTGGITIPRNAPPLFNLHLMDSLFWDGRVERLPGGTYRTPAGAQLTPAMTAVFEHGALSAIGLFPITNRDEMREHAPDGNGDDLTSIPDGDFTGLWEAEMRRLRAIPEYRRLFGEAYPSWPGTVDNRIDTMTFAHASNAMGAYFARMYRVYDTRWDEFVNGKNDAFKEIEDWTKDYPRRITELAVLQGAEKFMNTCANCHNGPLLSDNRFHNTAVAQLGPGVGDGPIGLDDFGRERVTTDGDARCGNAGSGASCRYAFRTTPLRNIVFTGPFGHAGEFGHADGAADFLTDLDADLDDLRRFIAHYAVNPADNLRTYDITELDESLQPSVLPNQEEIIAHIDPLFANGSPITPEDVDNLTAFMFALTGKKFLENAERLGSSTRLALCYRIPWSVPSGLPMDANRLDTRPDCHDHDHWDRDSP